MPLSIFPALLRKPGRDSGGPKQCFLEQHGSTARWFFCASSVSASAIRLLLPRKRTSTVFGEALDGRRYRLGSLGPSTIIRLAPPRRPQSSSVSSGHVWPPPLAFWPPCPHRLRFPVQRSLVRDLLTPERANANEGQRPEWKTCRTPIFWTKWASSGTAPYHPLAPSPPICVNPPWRRPWTAKGF